MTIYSADISDIMDAPTQITKKRRVSKKEPKPETEVLPTPPPSIPSAPEPKPKRVMSEKQKAALAAGQEKRRLKKEQEQQLKIQEQEMVQTNQKKLEEAEALKAAKKEAAREKRKAKRNINPEKELEQEIDQAVEEELKPKKRKLTKSQEDPPPWFRKYIEGVKKEQAQVSHSKTPKKQIQQEAHEEAKTKWGDGFVRDRLRNEVDGHMNRMYGMIFGARGMR